MTIEGMLYEYNEFEDLLGVVTELQLADIDDEERTRLLERWVVRMGKEPEEWMVRIVTGPPVGGEPAGEAEVTVG